MPTYSCPRCSRPVEDEFRVCPYCATPLGRAEPKLPVVTPAEREGRRDLAGVNAGLAVMAGLGAIGCIVAIATGKGYVQAWLGLTFCLVFILSLFMRGSPGKALMHGLTASLGLGCLALAVFGLIIISLVAAIGQVCSGLAK